MRRILLQLLAICGLAFSAPYFLFGATPSFQHDVLPILEQKCLACHGAKAMGGVDLRTLTSILAGGSSGPILIPGRADQSILLKALDSGRMPAGGQQLDLRVRQMIREWIENGQFPTREAAKAELLGSRVEAGRQFWSFRSPVKVQPPGPGLGNPIDAFISSKAAAKGLTLNPPETKAKLIRRAYFDLVGLPPKIEDVDAFVADQSPTAYESLIDRLLASPQYGERWARHWLDVAGYSDSNGYLGDEPRTEAWRYRDWVIRAFNDDKPYSGFLTEQLAGDQLTNWKLGERLSPESVDKLIATGFLRLPPDGSDNQSIYQLDKYYDATHLVTEVAIKAVMGINLNCARCHDHKFDPILQDDYYRIMAIFRPAFDPGKWLPANTGSGEWPSRFIPNATESELAAYIAKDKEIAPRIRARRREKADLYTSFRSKWQRGQFSSLEPDVRAELLKALDTPEGERTAAARELLRTWELKFPITNDNLEKALPELAQRLASVDEAGQIDDKALAAVRPEMIWALWDVNKQAETRILQRGNFLNSGDSVAAGIPKVFSDAARPFAIPSVQPDSPHTFRRLALARWLTSGSHPLVARVIVNRIWQFHFGEGLVRTPDDFGSQGARPSHPELLDWLAVDFVEHGWNIKRLHRQILRSATYMQSAATDPVKISLDPENRLLARRDPRRLEAEAIRDGMLAVSGRLDLRMYGQPIALCKALDGQFLADPSGRIDTLIGVPVPPCAEPKSEVPEARHPFRRSIYLQTKRTATLSLLTAFDMPMMETNAPSRFRSTVPSQSLALLHNPLVVQSAAQLASIASAESAGDWVKAIRRAYELAYSRRPGEAEIRAAFQTLPTSADPASAFRLFCQALLASNEFLYID